MDSFIASRFCSLCLKHGKTNGRMLQRYASNGSCVIGAASKKLLARRSLFGQRWYPVQSVMGQNFVRRMCSEPKQGENADSKKSVDEKIKNLRASKIQKSVAPISWKNVAIVFTIGGMIALWIRNLRQKKELEDAKRTVLSIGEAAIGGDWELIDTNGKLVTNKDLLGKWFILYFGFTHCPDVCPDELDKVVAAVNLIDSNAAIPNLKPVFITVDPDRDTGPVIKKYIEEFSPKFLGLTGTKEQVDKAAKAYRVYYSLGPKDEDDDYIVDHSIITYLVSPQGQMTDYFGKNKTAQEVAEMVEKRMRKHRKLESKGIL